MVQGQQPVGGQEAAEQWRGQEPLLRGQGSQGEQLASRPRPGRGTVGQSSTKKCRQAAGERRVGGQPVAKGQRQAKGAAAHG